MLLVQYKNYMASLADVNIVLEKLRYYKQDRPSKGKKISHISSIFSPILNIRNMLLKWYLKSMLEFLYFYDTEKVIYMAKLSGLNKSR